MDWLVAERAGCQDDGGDIVALMETTDETNSGFVRSAQKTEFLECQIESGKRGGD